MGVPWFRNKITKTRDSICSFKINDKKDDYECNILKLEDERIILYSKYEKYIKLYRIVNNNFILDLKLNFDYGPQNGGPKFIYEIDKDIILLGVPDLILIDLKKNIRCLQRININNLKSDYYKDYHYLKLSNGLIIINFSNNIMIFNYDKKNKKLIKKDEFIHSEIKDISIINNENILISDSTSVYKLNLNKKEIRKMRIDKDYSRRRYSILDNYYFVSYINKVKEKYKGNLDIYKIDLEEIEEIKLIQTIIFDYPYLILRFIKLNEKTLIAQD